MPRLLALAACLLLATPALAIDPSSFNRAANDLSVLNGEAYTDQLEELAAVVEAEPMAVADTLEREIGGRGAIRRYASAMLDTGQVARLARQTVLVLRTGDPAGRIHESLGQAEQQDGGTWFPRAEEAGYFLGGVAAAAAGHAGRTAFVAALAEELRLEPMPEGEALGPWLVVNVSRADGEGLGGAAMEWFEKGFEAASR